MKLASITGEKGRESIRCFKPVNKIIVVKRYSDKQIKDEDEKDIDIRVRLVNDDIGNSTEIVPKMKLGILSDISSKGEGFQRRPALMKPKDNAEDQRSFLEGFSNNTVVVGAQLDSGDFAAINLSNKKYLDISLENLDPRVVYDVYGFEHHIVSEFFRTYSTLFLPAGELNKNFSIGNNEILALPLDLVDEVQFYPRNNEAMGSPTYTADELLFESDTQNDITSVALGSDSRMYIRPAMHGGGSNGMSVAPIEFGASNWVILPVVDFVSVDVRRNENDKPLMLLLIDTKA